MRTVARYSMMAHPPAGRDTLRDYLNLIDRTEVWLRGKGERIAAKSPQEVIKYSDGREAHVERLEIDLDTAGLRELALAEPLDGGALFEAKLSIGLHDGVLATFCHLRVGGQDEPLGPVRFDASCPRIVRDSLSYDLPWCYGTFPLAKEPLRFRGTDGGEAFARLLTDAGRLLPVIAVAEYQGFVLHPGIQAAIAHDLASLVVVATLDTNASWRLSQLMGAKASCFSGSIRLYWPRFDADADPRTHPLWTSRRLLDGVPDTAAAAKRIRDVLRRQVMSASAFAVREPPVLDAIRAEERSRRFAAERDRLRSTDDYVRLAESYARESEELKVALDEKQLAIDALRDKVQNLEVALQWRDTGIGESFEPDTAVPPTTVREAVERARAEYVDTLVFGPSVGEGVEGLAADAGPPEKVLLYLSHLAELSRARAAGPIGTSPREWLRERNIEVSGEGTGVQRLWDGRNYDLHLKPSDAVSPDRCVRIYFEWDDQEKKTFVGWVGRHP